MDLIRLEKENNTFLKIVTTDDISMEMNSAFTFFVPNYKFHPKFRSRQWDGKIKVFNYRNQTIPLGLLGDVLKFGSDRGYDISMSSEVKDSFDSGLSKEDFMEWLKTIPFPENLKPRDYQLFATYSGLKNRRRVLLAATGTGKSLTQYLFCRYWQDVTPGKILMIVPTQSLVEQMYSDFAEYAIVDDSWMVEDNVERLYSGYKLTRSKDILISTWQSLVRIEDQDFWESFSAVLADECFSPNSLVLTKNGYVPIKDIMIGDTVINWSEDLKDFKEDVVVNVHKNLTTSTSEKMFELKFDNGETIQVTGNHKFLTNKGWCRADELTESHEVLDKNINTYN
jgi:hypothetical protein